MNNDMEFFENELFPELRDNPVGDFNATVSSLSGFTRDNLDQQLQQNQLEEWANLLVKDSFPDDFLLSMLQLLSYLSQKEQLNNFVIVNKNHPNERLVGQIYLAKGHGNGKDKIGKAIGVIEGKERNNFTKGGRHKPFRHESVPGVTLEYAGDSPPGGYEHIVLFDFFLNFSNTNQIEEGSQKNKKPEKGKKRKKEDRVVPEGYYHDDLRIFVGVFTRDTAKRRLQEQQQQIQQLQQQLQQQQLQHQESQQQLQTQLQGWTLNKNNNNNNNELTANTDVRVQGDIYANGFVTQTNAGVCDKNTKTNFRPVRDNLPKIIKTPLTSYQYINGDGRSIVGTIAQDIEKAIPGSTLRITGGAYAGKLAVDRDYVNYTHIGATQELFGIVHCMAKCILENQIEAGSVMSNSIRDLVTLLPPPSSTLSLDTLKEQKLVSEIDDEEEKPRLNTNYSANLVNQVLLQTRKIIGLEPELETQVSSNSEKPTQRWKNIEERLKELRVQRQKINASWEIHCRDCDTLLCDLSLFHFYAVPAQNQNFLVSNAKLSEWRDEVVVDSKTNNKAVAAFLKCRDCKLKIGRKMEHRGTGSPKPELEVRYVTFVNTKAGNTTRTFISNNEAYEFFANDLCILETRSSSSEDQIAEAREADERKREKYPERTRIFVRPIPHSGSTQATGKAIMCSRHDKVEDLIKKVELEFPKEPFEALFHNEDQIDVLDPLQYVNEVLIQDDKIYFGPLPKNSVILMLREYQQEVLQTAVKRNSAVVCPTGSGKTAVAVEVDRILRKNERNFKTVMVVRDLPLSVQQYHYFLANAGGRRIALLNSEHRLLLSWDDMLELYDVVVLTAQILLNNLKFNNAHLSKINLLILDEAHNTTKNHPFNCIMRDFYKNLNGPKPRILALTASPPAHVELNRTEKLIEEFQESTDCKIVLVDQYKELLKLHISSPDTIVHPIIPSHFEMTFNDLIVRTMSELESKRKQTTSEADEDETEMVRGSLEYDSTDNKQLQFLNTILMSLHDSAELAREELESREHDPSLPTVKKILAGIRTLESSESTKEKLFLETLNGFKDVAEFRAIVFVSTKKGGQKIESAIKNSGMSFLKPHVFFGHGNSQDKAGLGMNSKTQQKVLSDFNKGELNLLIATSVAEEGLDLTACNVVFRYDSVFSHRSLIQTRGRARQKNSKFIIFYHTNSTAEKAWLFSNKKLENMLLVLNEDLATSPFVSHTRYIKMSGSSIITNSLLHKGPTLVTKSTLKDENEGKQISQDREEEEQSSNSKDNVSGADDSEENEESEEEEEESDNESQLNINRAAPTMKSASSIPSTPSKTSSTSLSTPPSIISTPKTSAPSISSASNSPSTPSLPKIASTSSTPSTPSISSASNTPSTPSLAKTNSSPSTPKSLSTPKKTSSASSPSSVSTPSTSTPPAMLLNQAFQKKGYMKWSNLVKDSESKVGNQIIWKKSITLYTPEGQEIEFSGEGTTKAIATNEMARQVLDYSSKWVVGV